MVRVARLHRAAFLEQRRAREHRWRHREDRRSAACVITPLPNPPPQGGRERARARGEMMASTAAPPATTNASPSRPLPLAAALKDAVLSGAVAFGLFFFMIGLRTDQGSTGALEITTRFQTFAILVAAVVAGSFLR